MIQRALLWMTMRVWKLRQRFRRASIDQLCDRGLRLGRDVVVMHDVDFDNSYPWLIEVEDGCRISSEVRIMAHDATSFRDLGVTRIARVRILKGSFIGERAIILPGVTIGPRAMVAAGSVVSRDVGPDAMVAGNPARVYGKFDEYLERTKETVATAMVVPLLDVGRDDKRAAVHAALDRGDAVFVRDATPGTPDHLNITSEEVEANARAAYARHGRAKTPTT